MKKLNNYSLKNFLKYFYKLFLTVCIFESGLKFKNVKKKGIYFFFIRTEKEFRKIRLLNEYFKKNFYKKNRFKKNSNFIGIRNNNSIISSGWIYFGKSWEVEEVNKKINLNGSYLLYDFFTEVKFRNKGYYKLLLKLIQSKFEKKKLVIYSLSHNLKSIRAIKNSGFQLIRKIRKY